MPMNRRAARPAVSMRTIGTVVAIVAAVFGFGGHDESRNRRDLHVLPKELGRRWQPQRLRRGVDGHLLKVSVAQQSVELVLAQREDSA